MKYWPRPCDGSIELRSVSESLGRKTVWSPHLPDRTDSVPQRAQLIPPQVTPGIGHFSAVAELPKITHMLSINLIFDGECQIINDDCLILFKERNHVDNFLNYLNNIHVNITLTVEHEHNTTLPSLNILRTKIDNKLFIDVYRKVTFTVLGLNLISYVQYLLKVNSNETSIFKTYNICSS